MHIRKLRENEIPQLLDLYKHYTKEENLPDLSKEQIMNIWNQIESNHFIYYFIVEVDQKIVASSILSITPSFIRGGDGYGIIEHVVTHSHYRRRGYGKTLIKYILDFSWESGCSEVMLLSGNKNENAHKMYENIGFDKNRKKGFVIYKPENNKFLKI